VKNEKQHLLAPRQAAALAGVSTVAIWKARQRGEIRAAKITGRGALYTRHEITEWKGFRKRRQQSEGSPRPNLNEGLGKGRYIASLEGIRQTFDLWHRKALFHQWGEKEIQKAKDLLFPIADFWGELEERYRPFMEKRLKLEKKARKRQELAALSADSD